VAPGDDQELAAGLREGDVEDGLAALGAFKQELEGEGRLAGAGRALDQVELIGGQATAQDVVQAGDAGGKGWFFAQVVRIRPLVDPGKLRRRS